MDLFGRLASRLTVAKSDSLLCCIVHGNLQLRKTLSAGDVETTSLSYLHESVFTSIKYLLRRARFSGLVSKVKTATRKTTILRDMGLLTRWHEVGRLINVRGIGTTSRRKAGPREMRRALQTRARDAV